MTNIRQLCLASDTDLEVEFKEAEARMERRAVTGFSQDRYRWG